MNFFRHQSLCRVVPFCLVSAVAIAVSGCGNAKTPTKKQSKSADKAGSAKATNTAKDRCDSLMTSIVDMVQPERLEISASRVLCAETLNNWRSTCGSQIVAATAAPNATSVENLMTPEQKKVIDVEAFDGRDVDHVRDSLIARRAADVIVKDAANDLDRVVKVFYYVMRNVTLESRQQPKLSMTPYEINMLGHGTAEDRAWMFAEMLRQLRIDAVIVRPEGAMAPVAAVPAKEESKPAEPKPEEKAEEKKADEPAAKADETSESAPKTEDKKTDDAKSEEKPDDPKTKAVMTPKPVGKPWLVGVLLDKQVYLFDTRLGLPIPAASDNGTEAFIRQPATLKDVLANDALLRKLDVSEEQRYGLSVDDLKKFTVEIVADVAFWTMRMRALNSVFPPVDGRTVVLYDGLSDGDGGKGAVTRALEGADGLWSREQISVWSYPEAAWQAALNRDKQTTDRVAFLWSPFHATQSVDFDPSKMQPTIGEPTRVQLKTRTTQIVGEFPAAIRSYLSVQISEYPPDRALPLPPKVMEALTIDAQSKGLPREQIRRFYLVPDHVWLLHARASQDATYWIAVSQYEQGDFRSSVDSCVNVLRKYQNRGAWSIPAAALMAMGQAELKRYAEAVQTLNQVLKGTPDDHPQRHGWEVLSARWRAARALEEKSKEPEKKEDEKKESDPKESDKKEPEKPAETPSSDSKPEPEPKKDAAPEAEKKAD